MLSKRFPTLQEVLFLDADSFALSDPGDLFTSVDYTATGALLFQDYWDPLPASEVFKLIKSISQQVSIFISVAPQKCCLPHGEEQTEEAPFPFTILPFVPLG